MFNMVKIAESQAVTPEDFNKFGLFPRAAFDALIKDAIDPGIKFTGFPVAETAPGKVTVGAGRFYKNGEVFYDATEGGVELNLIGSLAVAARKIIAVVAYGSAIDTDVEPRTFLTNVTTRATEAQPTATENRRIATIDKVVGSESSNPTKPSIPANMVAVAWITVSTTGIVSIEIATENLLPNAADLFAKMQLVMLWKALIEAQLATLGTDIGNIAAALPGLVRNAALARVQADMARVKEQLHLPDEYVDYGSDAFLDEEESDTEYSGYAAKIDNGLLFPNAAEATSELELANQSDSNVKVVDGLMLPAYNEERVRIVVGAGGEIALNSFHYNARTIVVASMKRDRVQHGPQVLISSSSSWWGSGRWIDVQAGRFQKDGETFTALPSYVDGGVTIYRVSKWANYTVDGDSAYWNRVQTPEVYNGYQWCQTFLNTQDHWCTGLGIHFWPTLGDQDVTLAICETDDRAEPDVNKVLATVTMQRVNLDYGPFKFPIRPTYLEAGRRYGILIMTAGDYWVSCADSSSGTRHGGTLFFRPSGGHWESDPSKNILIDIYSATFTKDRTVVPLQPVQLAGGLSTLDIMAGMVKPQSCRLVYEAQVGGTWYALTPENGDIFNSLPALVNLRAIFAGTQKLQPGIELDGSQVIASRAATTMKHASTLRTTPAEVNQVKLVVMLENFDPDHATCTLKVDRGPGNIETADAVSDRTIAPGIVERTAVFGLEAGTEAYKRVIEGTCETHLHNFVVSEIVDVAEDV